MSKYFCSASRKIFSSLIRSLSIIILIVGSTLMVTNSIELYGYSVFILFYGIIEFANILLEWLILLWYNEPHLVKANYSIERTMIDRDIDLEDGTIDYEEFVIVEMSPR